MSSATPKEPATQSAAEAVPPAVESFIARWAKSGASERANYQLFLSELCNILGVPLPDPSVADDHENAYVFERRVAFEGKRLKVEGKSDGVEAASTRLSSSQASRLSGDEPKRQDAPSTFGYIDLYRRGAFVLETKQGVERKDREALSEAGREREARKRKGHGFRGTAGFDQVLLKAKHQADRYIRNLPASEGRPPFLIVVDVGHTIELYAEFTRTGGIYSPFPPGSHRIHLADLRRPEIRERLRLVWTNLANCEVRISNVEWRPKDRSLSKWKIAA